MNKNDKTSLFQLLGKDEKLLERLLNSAPAGLLIVDEIGQIVFFNTEAERMFGYLQEEVLGKQVELLIPERFRAQHIIYRQQFTEAPMRREMGSERNLWACRKDGSEFPVEAGLGYGSSGIKVLISVVLVDITKRKAVENERESLIRQLQSALEKVKLLNGLLPICANCKNIRDDNGYWNQIESYIQDHSEAEFSHGICPECVKKLYPDLF